MVTTVIGYEDYPFLVPDRGLVFLAVFLSERFVNSMYQYQSRN